MRFLRNKKEVATQSVLCRNLFIGFKKFILIFVILNWGLIDSNRIS